MAIHDNSPIFLSGTFSRSFKPLLGQPGFGLLVQPKAGLRFKIGTAIWAADNGCFTRPDAFNAERYIGWLKSHDLTRCLFATAPDVVGAARATLIRSEPVLPKIRQLGIRAALVAQDGLVASSAPWDWFDALFIGGTTTWKYSRQAYGLVHAAKQFGKWVHVGRVNSQKCLRRARWMGADSVDGNFLRYAPDGNVKRLVRWFRQQELAI